MEALHDNGPPEPSGPAAAPQQGTLTALWAARGVAVVGASPRPGSPGRRVVEALLRHGYPGTIAPVHPSAAEVAGVPAVPSVRAVAGRVDLAMILVPAAAVPDAVEDCTAAGVTVAIVGSSGFAETGPEGLAAQQALAAQARAAGIRLVGPNCIGAANLRTGQIASFSPMFQAAPGPAGRDRADLTGEQATAGAPEAHIPAGGIGFASVSGALGYGTVSLALARDMPLHTAVTTGNEADVTALEVLAALADDADCAVLLGYLEGLADRIGLQALAEARRRTGKPVALLVAGRSTAGAQAAASHTGALATPDRLVDAALRRCGAVRVFDVAELLDVGDAFALRAHAAAPAGPRVAVVTTSGGAGILAADAIEAHGLTLASLAPQTEAVLRSVVPAYGSVANPVDVTATVMSDRALVGRCLQAVAADPGVDAIVVCFCVLVGADVDAIVTALDSVVRTSGKPVLVSRTGAEHLAPEAAAALRAAGVPAYPTPARAVRAVAALWQATVGPQPVGVEPVGAAPPEGGWSESELKARLRTAGIRVPRGQLVTDPAHAADAVVACGGRAVCKVVAPGLVHKTEAGGVVLGVTAADAAATAARLLALPRATAVLVEEQVPAGIEVLIGVAPSPLGRVLTVGAGGVLTEVYDDAQVCLLPAGRAEIQAMLGRTRVARQLAGVRGAAPADVDALIDLILRVTDLTAGWPGTLDLNPVAVHASGAVVLDAAYLAGQPTRVEI